MPSPPKIYFHGSNHFVTTSVEEGFVFPPNPLINTLLEKCVAQAQELHPVIIHHKIFTSTHVHMTMTVIDPQDASDFMERFKCESANAVNRLLGRERKTVWCEDYDSPLIDDPETMIAKIVYIYENPSRDGLVDSIDSYPGVCSWQQLVSCASGRGAAEKRHETRAIPRNAFTQLPEDRFLKEEDYRRLKRKVIRKRKKRFYTVDCNGWMKRFGITDRKEQLAINRAIVERVRMQEEEHRRERQRRGMGVIGRRKLVQRPVGTPYTPKRSGRKMLTHSNDPEKRRETLKWMMALIRHGREVQEQWRQGDMTVSYPMGLFPPTGMRLVEPICW